MLNPAMPFHQEQGRGETVVCLHSNASTSAQWHQLSELLADRFCVRAVDGYGAGRSPDWPPSTEATLDAEVDFLCTALQDTHDRFHLVGHSYGAAVALQMAVRYLERVRSIVAYEPTLFRLVAGNDPAASPAAGIWQAAGDAAAMVQRGDNASAAERFVDFWMASGSWRDMPAKRQGMVAHAVRHVGRWRDATFATSAPAPALAAAFAALQIPVLLMWGDCSPESAQSVARLLETLLPRVTLAPKLGLGHMGPVTDAERVTGRIASFLDLHRSPHA